MSLQPLFIETPSRPRLPSSAREVSSPVSDTRPSLWPLCNPTSCPPSSPPLGPAPFTLTLGKTVPGGVLRCRGIRQILEESARDVWLERPQSPWGAAEFPPSPSCHRTCLPCLSSCADVHTVGTLRIFWAVEARRPSQGRRSLSPESREVWRAGAPLVRAHAGRSWQPWPPELSGRGCSWEGGTHCVPSSAGRDFHVLVPEPGSG